MFLSWISVLIQNEFLQSFQALLQGFALVLKSHVLRRLPTNLFSQFDVFGFHLFVEALDGGESDAIGINGCNMFVIFAHLKRGGKVLRHWAEMANGFILSLVIPGS